MRHAFRHFEDVEDERKQRIHTFFCSSGGAWQCKDECLAFQAGNTSGEHGIGHMLLAILTRGFGDAGGFVEAWLRTHGDDAAARQTAREVVTSLGDKPVPPVMMIKSNLSSHKVCTLACITGISSGMMV